MVPPARLLTTNEQRLRAAIEDAEVPVRDYRIFMAIHYRADWKTAILPGRFQPRSLDDVARWAHMSRANVKYGLAHLELHGWISRGRKLARSGAGGRGNATTYELRQGFDCDCKAAKSRPVAEDKAAKNHTLKRPKSDGIAAGHAPVSAEEGRDEGEREGAASEWGCWPDDTIGADVNVLR